MSENRKVPDLRFPETVGEWTTHRLDEISKIERGRFSPRPRNNPIYYGGKIPFVQTGDVVRSNGRISSYSQTLNEKGLEVSKLFPAGSILITIAANIGFSGILQEPMACPDSLIGLTCKSGVNNVFLNYLLQIEQPNMDLLASAAAQKNINVEFLKPYKFNLPSLPEQQKIAEFLTAVDRRIELLQAKKEKLEAYKKGVMQKIFSQKLRFKADDGSDFQDWEERKLGEVARITTGSSNRQDSGTEGEYTFFDRSVDLRRSSIFLFDCEAVIVPGEGQDFIPKHFEGKFDLHQRTYAILDFQGCLGLFIYILLSHDRKHLLSQAVGSTVKSLRLPIFQSLPLRLPNIEEQKKIVEFLTSLDKSIENLNQQITHTQTWKKGLLQKMFV